MNEQRTVTINIPADKPKGPTKTYIAMDAVDHDHKRYDIGEEIELTEVQAMPMLKLAAIVEKGDKLAAKVVEANKVREEQELKDAHAKLEARAKGEEPNNLGREVVVTSKPASLDPGYRIVGVTDTDPAPVPKSGRVGSAPGAVSVGRSGHESVKTSGLPARAVGPGPSVPGTVGSMSGRGGVKASAGGTKVSYGKPGSTAGKPPVGGKPKSGRK